MLALFFAISCKERLSARSTEDKEEEEEDKEEEELECFEGSDDASLFRRLRVYSIPHS